MALASTGGHDCRADARPAWQASARAGPLLPDSGHQTREGQGQARRPAGPPAGTLVARAAPFRAAACTPRSVPYWGRTRVHPLPPARSAQGPDREGHLCIPVGHASRLCLRRPPAPFWGSEWGQADRGGAPSGTPIPVHLPPLHRMSERPKPSCLRLSLLPYQGQTKCKSPTGAFRPQHTLSAGALSLRR